MIIKKVDNVEEANQCDALLTKLLIDEKNYNNNIKPDYEVKNYFCNVYFKETKAVFVAKEDETVIGYISCKITSDDEGPELFREGLIDGLYVEEEYRNNGIATKLFEKVKEWCEEKQIKYISIHVLDKNEVAKNLYKDLGFDTFYIDLKYEL